MTTVFKTQCEDQVKRYKKLLASPGERLSLPMLALIASVSAFGLLGCAQTPVGSTNNSASSSAASGMSMGGPSGSMAQMDAHMKMMRETHEKMMQATSPEERKTLMATHMKQMQDGMAMMGGMGSGGMAGMQGSSPMSGDMTARQQMMEKRMEMMQMMMQMMMERMPPAPNRQ